MIAHSRIYGRLDIFPCTCRDSHLFRNTNLKVTFGFTIINTIAATTLKLVTKKECISFDILPLKVNVEFNIFLILKITFKLTQDRMSWIVFSRVSRVRTVCYGTCLE